MTVTHRPSRSEAIARAEARGQRIAAVLPYHYPRALLRAHGFHPVEVWGPPGVPRDEGGRHFQAYTCDIVVRATSFLLRGGLERAGVLLVPHTCDALQGMGSVAGDFLQPSQHVLTLYLPRAGRPTDREYLVAELRRLSDRLAGIAGGRPTDAGWADALAAEEAADETLAALYRDREALAVGDREFYEVVRSREYLAAEEFVEAAAAVPRGTAPSGIGLLLSGIVPEPMSLFDHLAEAGARVVADDLAAGARRLYPPSDAADPIERLADRLLGSPPDPTRGTPIAARAAALAGRMAAAGAKGMLIYDVAFCEPELFDVPLLRRHLGDAGYPVAHVEVELGGELGHRVITRIEAFVETLA
ncbi:MAG: 2-hydroxyacyl-CoA dehydratase family protein [Actinobacteria bacterium]|nr:2-hydroxyacyl-CoA dehydratase family protein [Actinomycetota bacterium]